MFRAQATRIKPVQVDTVDVADEVVGWAKKYVQEMKKLKKSKSTFRQKSTKKLKGSTKRTSKRRTDEASAEKQASRPSTSEASSANSTPRPRMAKLHRLQQKCAQLRSAIAQEAHEDQPLRLLRLVQSERVRCLQLRNHVRLIFVPQVRTTSPQHDIWRPLSRG